MTDEQINEVMRLVRDAVVTNSLFATEQIADMSIVGEAKCALVSYLRTIGEPAGYSLPAGSMGEKKWAQLPKDCKPIGLVFQRIDAKTGAITEAGRVTWADWLAYPEADEPESVNAELLEALKSAKTWLEWYQDAHPESASECDNEAMQEIDAAIARAESAIEGSHKHFEPWQPIETAPHDEVLLLACEFDGPGDWRIKCGYFDDDLGGWKVWGASWVPTSWAAIPAPPNLSDAARRDQTPAKVSPCAGHAVQQDADDLVGLRGCNSRHGGMWALYPCIYRMRTTDPGCTGCVERDEDQPAEANHEND